MYTFFDFNLINVRGAEKGTKYSTCPICSHERKKTLIRCQLCNWDDFIPTALFYTHSH